MLAGDIEKPGTLYLTLTLPLSPYRAHEAARPSSKPRTYRSSSLSTPLRFQDGNHGT